MKISLLHPSRNRAAPADAAVAEWLGKCSGRHAIEYILSIDDSDGQIAEYRQVARRHGARLIIHPNRNYVEASNRAALVATGDLLVIVSDDFGCPPGWDDALALAVGDQRDVAVLIDDGLGARTMTLPIVGRTFYQRTGYLLFPGYIHLFSDNDLEEAARRLGKLIDARHLLFPHRHYTAGASPHDETYRNSDGSWGQGERMLAKRRMRDFDIRPPTIRDVLRDGWMDVNYYWHGMQRVLRRAVRRVGSKFYVR